MDKAGDRERALALVRIHEHVRTAREVVDRLAREVEDYDPRIVHRAERIAAKEAQQRAVADDLLELLDVVEMAYAQREVLLQARARPVDIPPQALVELAAKWLATSVADEREVRLAARLLPPHRGLLALADGLSSSEGLRVTGASLRSVLGAFRDFPASAVDTVTSRAEVHPEVRLNALDTEQLPRLIAALRSTAVDFEGGDL